MSLLNNLKSDDTIANEKDSVGNSVLESGLYNATVALAYVTQSTGGATGLVLHAKTESGPEIRQTLWMTSGTAKGGKNYYEKDGVKNYLPGFLLANSLALLAGGAEISDMATETKVVKLYNKDAKAEVPTKVEMLVDLIGKEITIGLIKQTVDKTKKNDVTNIYEPTGETRDENEVDKFFRASDKMTTAEIRAEATDASFYATWEKKHAGTVRNKASKTAGTAGAPRAGGSVGAAATAKPKTSLFA